MAQNDYIDFDPDDVGGEFCTVSREETGEGRFIKQRDGIGRYAHVKVVVSPHPGIRCYRFVWRPLAASLPGSYHDLDTDRQAVTIAAFMAVQDALARAPIVSA